MKTEVQMMQELLDKLPKDAIRRIASAIPNREIENAAIFHFDKMLDSMKLSIAALDEMARRGMDLSGPVSLLVVLRDGLTEKIAQLHAMSNTPAPTATTASPCECDLCVGIRKSVEQADTTA